MKGGPRKRYDAETNMGLRKRRRRFPRIGSDEPFSRRSHPHRTIACNAAAACGLELVPTSETDSMNVPSLSDWQPRKP